MRRFTRFIPPPRSTLEWIHNLPRLCSYKHAQSPKSFIYLASIRVFINSRDFSILAYSLNRSIGLQRGGPDVLCY